MTVKSKYKLKRNGRSAQVHYSIMEKRRTVKNNVA